MTLPLMYLILETHENPVGSRFIISSPKKNIKPISKDITTIIKLFYKN